MSATCQPASQVGKWYDAGQFAMIYFFEYGHEISNHEKGRVESLFVANNLVYDREELGEWCFSFLRKLNGATRMVDCGKCPESELCRTRRAPLPFIKVCLAFI